MDRTKREPPHATLRCARCRDVIGVYEPLLHVVDGIARRTSRAAEPELVHAEGGSCYHLACGELDRGGIVAGE
jgi:hypothetical protein